LEKVKSMPRVPPKLTPRVEMEESLRQRAEAPLLRMLEQSK
jgi:hypothetical protein